MFLSLDISLKPTPSRWWNAYKKEYRRLERMSNNVFGNFYTDSDKDGDKI